MKNIGMLLLAGIVATSVVSAKAFADDDATLSSAANTSTSTETEVGPFTSEHPVASHIVTAPFRLVTGTAAGAMGLVGGTAKGIGTGVQNSFEYAGKFGPQGDEMYQKAGRGVLYAPTATVGTVYYVPRNIAVEGSKTTAEFAGKGYRWWDRF